MHGSAAGRFAAAALLGVLLSSGAGVPASGAPAPADPEIERVQAAVRAKDWEQARALADALLRARPGHRSSPAILLYSAEASFHLNRPDETIEATDRFLRTGRPLPPPIALLRARALLMQYRPDDAKREFEAILAGRPDPRIAEGATSGLARIDRPYKAIRGNVVFDYEGKYKGNPRFAARVAEVERRLPSILAAVRARLGIAEGAPPPSFLVRFEDLGETQEGAMMRTGEEFRGGRPLEVVTIFTEPLVAGAYVFEEVLAHELVHVCHHQALGPAFYRVPKWVREGLAVWAPGQTERHRVFQYNRISTSLATKDPVERLVTGLDGPHDGDDYLEDAFAFLWVERVCGAEAAAALVRDLLRSPDCEAAFARASGRPFPEAAARMRAFAAETVRADLAGKEDYERPHRLLRDGKFPEAVRGYDEMLRASPDHILAPRARMDRAFALFRAGRTDDSLAALDERDSKPFAEIFRAEAAELRLQILARKGDRAALAEGTAAFLRDFSFLAPQRLAAVRARLAAPR